MTEKPNQHPTIAMGIKERVAAFAPAIAMYAMLYFWLGWTAWLSAACAVVTFSVIATSLFFLADARARKIESLRAQGLLWVANSY